MSSYGDLTGGKAQSRAQMNSQYKVTVTTAANILSAGKLSCMNHACLLSIKYVQVPVLSSMNRSLSKTDACSQGAWVFVKGDRETDNQLTNSIKR